MGSAGNFTFLINQNGASLNNLDLRRPVDAYSHIVLWSGTGQTINDVEITTAGTTGYVIISRTTATFNRLFISNQTAGPMQITTATAAPTTVNYSRFEDNGGQIQVDTSGYATFNNSIFRGFPARAILFRSTIGGNCAINNSIFIANDTGGTAVHVVHKETVASTVTISNSIMLNSSLGPTVGYYQTVDGGGNLTTSPKFISSKYLGIIVMGIDDQANIAHWATLADIAHGYGQHMYFALSFPQLVTAGEWTTLASKVADGHEIVSHGRSHSDLTQTKAFTVTKAGGNIQVDRTNNHIIATPGGTMSNFKTATIGSPGAAIAGSIIKQLEDWGYTVSSLNVQYRAMGEILDDSNNTTDAGYQMPLLRDITLAGGYFKSEILDSKTYIEANIPGYTVKSFAYPGGLSDTDSQTAVKNAGLLGARATGSGTKDLRDIYPYNVYGVTPVTYLGSTASGQYSVSTNAHTLAEYLMQMGYIWVLYQHTAAEWSVACWTAAMAAFAATNIRIMTLFEALEHINNTQTGYLPAGTDVGGAGTEYTRILTDSSNSNLSSNSPAINAGTSVGLTRDYLGTVVPKGAAPDMGAYEYDATAPTLSQTTAVITPTTDTTPNYVFNSNEAGTISYGGSCSSSATSAAIGDNTITFTTLTDGTYLNCTVTVTDPAGNVSLPLSVSSFTIDTTAPSSVGAPTFGTITTSSIIVNKPTTVTENGSGLYQWQARRDSATELGFIATTTTSVTNSALSENTQYTYDVQFKDYASNASAWGASAQKYTLADTPSGFAGTAGLTTMDLSVDALPNATADSSGYSFSRSGANSSWIQTNSWSDSGLSCGTSYDYTVKYRNGDGTETATASLTKSTSACPGGGGMPSEWWNPPKAPTGGFGVSINGGIESTSIPTVVLNFKGGPDTTRMAISNFSDFRDAGLENYTSTSTKLWNLCWKSSMLQTPSTCPAGTYTVYAKYYTPWGTASDVVSAKINLAMGSLIPTPSSTPSAKTIFKKDLKLGQTSADVKRLQIFLNYNPTTQLAKSGVGSPGKETNFFGILTKKAVIKFQEKYSQDILAPWKLTKGTGFVGKTTMAKINQLLGF